MLLKSSLTRRNDIGSAIQKDAVLEISPAVRPLSLSGTYASSYPNTRPSRKSIPDGYEHPDHTRSAVDRHAQKSCVTEYENSSMESADNSRSDGGDPNQKKAGAEAPAMMPE